MDENLRTSASKATAVYTTFLGVMLFIGGITVLFTYPLEIWFLGLILVPLSVYLFFNSLKWFKNMKREQVISEAEQKTIHQLVQNNQTTSPTLLTGEAAGIKHPLGKEALQVTILAQWNYTPQQWQQFMRWEKKERKTEHIILSVLILILGTFLLRASRDASWAAAIGVSFAVALLYSIISYRVSAGAIKLKSKEAAVIITRDAVLVNGHYNRLHGENLWLEGVVMKHTDAFAFLEFTTAHNTSTGNVKNELRIPVPPGKEIEANALVKEFENKKMGQ